MPVDVHRKGSVSRLNFRDRRVETKRVNGEASCAECRRLKLKCDRKNPCTSCVRRGCQTICPNGALSGGQGTRFVLATTDKLHSKLLQMSQRIRQLEDALQIAQASITPASHHLLSEDLLSIKSCADVMVAREDRTDDVNEVGGELGTLSISEHGESCFMGRGSSEALLMVINEALPEQPGKDDHSNHALNVLPDNIVSVSKAFPFASAHLPKAETLKMIEATLPSYARATSLAEAYLTNIAWSFVIVDREQIFEELLPSVYKRNSAELYGTADEESIYTRRLALLLAVLARGAAGDYTLPMANDEAELYVHLSRTVFSLDSVFVSTSMENVQTVLMLSVYDFASCRNYSLEPSWKMMSFGLTLAASIGLHRDPARWNMERKCVQRRRRLFWEIFFMDKWKSLESGKPATFNLREIDCEFPEDNEATFDEDGTVIPGFGRWKHRLTKEVLAPIAEKLCLTKPIKYSEVLELDRKFRDFEVHRSISLSNGSDVDEDAATVIRRYSWSALREIGLLFVHRSFFARAMLDCPNKPIDSPFVSSLLSAYVSATTLLSILEMYFEKHPSIILRQWIIWSHGLTSAVIVGCTACRGPASHVAAPALKELEKAVQLFHKAQTHPIPRRALPFLLRLLAKAQRANDPVPKEAGAARQELNILGGAPLLLNRSTRKSSPSSNDASHTFSRLGPSANSFESDPENTSASSCVLPGGQSGFAGELYASQSVPMWLQQRPYLPADVNALPSSGTHSAWIDTTGTSLPVDPYSQSGRVPFVDTTHQTQSTQELNSTTEWLQQIPNNMLSRSEEDFSENADLDLGLLLGRETLTDPNLFLGSSSAEDPVLTEAWKSLIGYSQGLGSDMNTSI